MNDPSGGRQSLYRRILRQNPGMERIVREITVPPGDAVALASVCVLGPALGSFTQWLLKEACGNGLNRLYFLARDGYLMHRAALLFCETLGLPIACRYLSCSRYSLRLPVFHLDREAALDFLCRNAAGGVTMEMILGRAGLNQVETAEIMRLIPLPLSSGEHIPNDSLPQVRRALAACRPFLERMESRSREAMPGLAGYLRQEGLLEGAPYAIVDSGWTGTMQQTLCGALRALGRSGRLEGYYWGLYDLPLGACRADYHCCYFGPEGGLREKAGFNNCLFEAVYTAPHGMTLGYARQDEGYAPVYGISPPGRNAFLRKIEAYTLQYVRILASQTGKADWEQYDFEADRAAIRALMRTFMRRPSEAEAEAFGSLPFSDDVLEGGEESLAAPLTPVQLRAHHLLPRLHARGGILRESAWYEGSVVRYGRHTGYHLMHHTWYQYLRYIQKIYRFRRERREKK